MIKNQAYIRSFSDNQKALLERISREEKIKNASDVFLFVLERYTELTNENARLKRLIAYKQKNIDQLKDEKDAGIRQTREQDQDGNINHARLP